MEVKFYDTKTVQKGMCTDRKCLSADNTIYVQENVIWDEQTKTAGLADVNSNICSELLSFDEVVPLGFSAENAITCLKNQGYKWAEAPSPFGKFDGLTELKHHVYHFNKPLAK